jgi:hypothetical protein
MREGLIYQFEISETTLEEVFIFLSKMQVDSESQAVEASSTFCCWERNSQGCFLIC